MEIGISKNTALIPWEDVVFLEEMCFFLWFDVHQLKTSKQMQDRTEPNNSFAALWWMFMSKRAANKKSSILKWSFEQNSL